MQRLDTAVHNAWTFASLLADNKTCCSDLMVSTHNPHSNLIVIDFFDVYANSYFQPGSFWQLQPEFSPRRTTLCRTQTCEWGSQPVRTGAGCCCAASVPAPLWTWSSCTWRTHWAWTWRNMSCFSPQPGILSSSSSGSPYQKVIPLKTPTNMSRLLFH